MKFMTYQNKRGGSIVLTPIESPPKNDWVGARHAMSEALKLEKNVNDVCVFENISARNYYHFYCQNKNWNFR